MRSKVKAFLAMYDRKMPANGVPFELSQRLVFSKESAERTAQIRRPWTIVLNTYIVAATILISAFTFWQLGENSLFIWSLPPADQQEVIPSEMLTYLETNTDSYLDWSIFNKDYPDEMTLKFYVGMKGEDLYFFTYLEPSKTLFAQISSDEGQFMLAGTYDTINIDKALIETRSNITVSIWIVDSGTEIHDDYVFRIPKYLEIFQS